MSRRSTAFFQTLTALTLLALLAGCSSLSPYSNVTKVNLKLTGSDQLNPDLNGRPSPIVVRLFELKHPVTFENADFFSLYERAKESLNPDLVASEELELRPGETVELKLSVEEGSRYVGILAAYRDLPDTQWRHTVQITPLELTEADLTLDAGDQLNPDLNGRPSPIVVRLFELKHPVAFEHADFFSLYERAKESLAPDLVVSEELELRPGEHVTLRLSVDPGSRYVGVLAAYRDLPETKWRYTVQVTPVEVTEADLTLDQAGIRNSNETLAKADD